MKYVLVNAVLRLFRNVDPFDYCPCDVVATGEALGNCIL